MLVLLRCRGAAVLAWPHRHVHLGLFQLPSSRDFRTVLSESSTRGFLRDSLLTVPRFPALKHAEQVTALLFILSGLYPCSTTGYRLIRLTGI